MPGNKKRWAGQRITDEIEDITMKQLRLENQKLKDELEEKKKIRMQADEKIKSLQEELEIARDSNQELDEAHKYVIREQARLATQLREIEE